MPSFKPKSNKKIKFNKKSTVTIDTKHKEFLNDFSKDESNILENKRQILKFKKQLQNENESLSIEQKLEIQDKIIELNKSPGLGGDFPLLFDSIMDYIVDYQFKPEKKIEHAIEEIKIKFAGKKIINDDSFYRINTLKMIKLQ